MLTLVDTYIIQEWLVELTQPHWNSVEDHLYDARFSCAYWIRDIKSQAFIQLERHGIFILSSGMPNYLSLYKLQLADPDVESKIKKFFGW